VETNESSIDELVRHAEASRSELSSKSHDDIAHFLHTIADGIDNLSDDFVSLAVKETALPDTRINGERARTSDQLRKFACLVEEGSWVDARINWGGGKDIRRMLQPLGTVGVFGASNFPLAFCTYSFHWISHSHLFNKLEIHTIHMYLPCIFIHSLTNSHARSSYCAQIRNARITAVAGGDTAAALAARNPVIVKAHPAHPGVSECVADVIREAVEKCSFPRGTFSMFQSTCPNVAQALVRRVY
jgi:NADP-dependent aldehyde dehydrogenase